MNKTVIEELENQVKHYKAYLESSERSLLNTRKEVCNIENRIEEFKERIKDYGDAIDVLKNVK